MEADERALMARSQLNERPRGEEAKKKRARGWLAGARRGKGEDGW